MERLTGVIHSYDVWMVTSPEVRRNRRVSMTKDALLEMFREAADALSGVARVPL
ncbi:MAG: hypothetical protein FJ104_07010 [Deltaproteobacteria bacterium]|nr:hypothetical protein [Deltaproteobacteria bacterium]